MNAETTRLILTGIDAAPWRSAVEASAFGPFVVEEVAQWAGLQTDVGTVVLVAAGSIGNSPEDQRALARLAADIPVWVLVPSEATDLAERLWRCGVDEVLTPDELRQPALPRRLRAAVERKRRAREERTTYATDLSTGLPHQQQLIEHMSHLMALREREPAPMAVLVLRVEGFATTEARLGREAANVLRRKLAVRLRAGVRASDVVAFIGADSFAVLLASILAPADAQRVGAKLLAALQVPFKVSGQDLALAVAVGVGHYPDDGNQPEQLLRQAIALAAAPVQGRTGHANFTEAGGSVPAAANDE